MKKYIKADQKGINNKYTYTIKSRTRRHYFDVALRGRLCDYFLIS